MKGKLLYLLVVLSMVLGFLPMAIPARVAAAQILYEHWNDSDVVSNSAYYTKSIWMLGQTFTAISDHSVSSVKLKIRRNGLPGMINVYFRATVDGSNLATGSYNGNDVTNSGNGDWYDIALNPVSPGV